VEIPLDPDTNRTGDIWHIAVPDLPSDFLYGAFGLTRTFRSLWRVPQLPIDTYSHRYHGTSFFRSRQSFCLAHAFSSLRAQVFPDDTQSFKEIVLLLASFCIGSDLATAVNCRLDVAVNTCAHGKLNVDVSPHTYELAMASGYRVYGAHESDPDCKKAAGLRHDSSKVLLDPYATSIVSRPRWGEFGNQNLDYEDDSLPDPDYRGFDWQVCICICVVLFAVPSFPLTLPFDEP
jgi:hypothetical protein